MDSLRLPAGSSSHPEPSSSPSRGLLQLPASVLRNLEQLHSRAPPRVHDLSAPDQDDKLSDQHEGARVSSSGAHSTAASVSHDSLSSCSSVSGEPSDGLCSGSLSSEVLHPLRGLGPSVQGSFVPSLSRPHSSQHQGSAHSQDKRDPRLSSHLAGQGGGGLGAQHLGQVAEASEECEEGPDEEEGEEPEDDLRGLPDLGLPQESGLLGGGYRELREGRVGLEDGHLSPQEDGEGQLGVDLPPRLSLSRQSSQSGPPRARPRRLGRPPAAAKQVGHCVHCQGRFRQSTLRLDGRLCANCFKAHESVARTAEAHGGALKLVVRAPGHVVLQLSCSERHTWSLGLQSRKAKAWCRQCKEEQRAESARRQREHLERLWVEQLRSQRLLFEQARLHQATQPPEAVPAPSQQELLHQSQRRQLHYLLVEQLLDPAANPLEPRLQFEVADLVLAVDEAVFVDFLHQLADDDASRSQSSLHQLVQRLRLCLHPDKNRCHPRAGEAFARMTQCTYRFRIRYKDKNNITNFKRKT